MNKDKGKQMSAAERRETVGRLARNALVRQLGIQHDGALYAIHPRSESLMKERYPDVVPLPSIMLGHCKAVEFEKLNPPRWERMVLMLTGLNREQIAELGGVRIYDQEDERLVWEWQPEVVRS